MPCRVTAIIMIEPHHKTDLQLELERLRQNYYATIFDVIADLISKRKGLTLFSFHCQSLRSHFNDLNDQVTQRANTLIVSKTWLENGQEEPNFNCIVNYKPQNVRGEGAATLMIGQTSSLHIWKLTFAKSLPYQSMFRRL